MRAASVATLDNLSIGQWKHVECYDIALPGSAGVLHYTNIDSRMTFGSTTYVTGFVITRGAVTQKLGLDEQSCDIVMAPLSDVATPPLINGQPLQTAIQLGFFDQADVTIWEAFLSDYGDTSPGLTHLFKGRVSGTKAGRLRSTITVTSGIALLDIDMPRNIVQAGCVYDLFGPGCKLQRSNFLFVGEKFAGTPGVLTFNTTLPNIDGYFNLGTIDCTSGINNGLSRFVRSSLHAGGQIQLFQPWPQKPAAGDTFNISPGCNKSQTQCYNANPALGPAFNNKAHFRGATYVPAVETLYDGGAITQPGQGVGKQGTSIAGSSFSSSKGNQNYVP